MSSSLPQHSQQPHPPKGALPAFDEPERIEPGVWRISVPLPFALRAANIYLLDDGAGGWTLVDSGLGLPADEAALRAGLAVAGVPLERITALVLTHAHPDHIGLSGLVQEASGAPVYVLAGEDAHLFDVWSAEARDAFATTGAHYEMHGLSPEDVAAGVALSRKTRSMLRLPTRASLQLVSDGERLRLGTHTFEAIWTPGHSDFHLCLLRDDGLFIAGDHILPGITPNIGLYPHSRPDPLRDYFEALARVRSLPARLVLPGHRQPFVKLTERVDALRAHHLERSAYLRETLHTYPEGATAATLSSALFGERLRGPDDRRFALVETLAHLEYLRLDGRADHAKYDGVMHYRPA